MKNLILLAGMILLLPAPAVCGQNIVAAEYYFDDDPGEGNGTLISFKQGIAPIDFSDDFDSENGGIGELNYTGFVNWNVTDGAVDIVGEGFVYDEVDFDFWPGNGQYVDLDGTTDKAGTLTSKTAFSFAPGEYTLEFRLAGSKRGDTNSVTVTLGNLYTEKFTKTSDDPFETITRTITVTSHTTANLSFDHADTEVAQYGLLLDNVRLTSKNMVSNSEFEMQINLPYLTVGPHFLYVRMKNEQGVWGISRKHLIMVTGSKTIQAAEYFIDNDPGEGKGIALTSTETQFSLSGINTSSLTVGLHKVFVRMKNSEGTWGPPRQFVFEVSAPPTIKAAEYFIGDDPGAGSGFALTASDGTFDGTTEDIQGEIDTSALEFGIHTCSFRVMDSYSRWGSVSEIDIEARKHTNPTISGRISSSVAGWDDLAVKNATISLEGTSNYSATTDDNGEFIFLDVPLGSYTLKANVPGFETYTKPINWTGEQGLVVNVPFVASGECGTLGDINGDGFVDLKEVIHALQVVTGITH